MGPYFSSVMSQKLPLKQIIFNRSKKKQPEAVTAWLNKDKERMICTRQVRTTAVLFISQSLHHSKHITLFCSNTSNLFAVNKRTVISGNPIFVYLFSIREGGEFRCSLPLPPNKPPNFVVYTLLGMGLVQLKNISKNLSNDKNIFYTNTEPN